MPSPYATDLDIVLSERDRVRFESKFKRTEGCWEWRGSKNPKGYGELGVQGQMRRAHRIAYFLYVGRITDKTLTIDHICRNRGCVNPDHMQLLTQPENASLGVHIIADVCRNGHMYDAENTRYSREGNPPRLRRTCRACKREEMRRRRARSYPQTSLVPVR